MRAVNLLPRQDNEKGKLPAIPVLVACGCAIAMSAFLALSYLSASSTVGQRKQELADAQTQLAQIPAPTPPPAIVTQLPAQRTDRTTVLSSVLTTRIAFDRVLREVSQVVPSDVWLTQLVAGVPAAAAIGAAPADNFTIQGYCYSQDGVARFLARLEIVPDLVDVKLGTSGATRVGNRDVVQFTIGARLRQPGTTS